MQIAERVTTRAVVLVKSLVSTNVLQHHQAIDQDSERVILGLWVDACDKRNGLGVGHVRMFHEMGKRIH